MILGELTQFFLENPDPAARAAKRLELEAKHKAAESERIANHAKYAELDRLKREELAAETKQEFLNKLPKPHLERYDYSNTYVNNITDTLSVICRKHGDFKVWGPDHISGKGCVWCDADDRNKYGGGGKAYLYVYRIRNKKGTHLGFFGFGKTINFYDRNETHQRNFKLHTRTGTLVALFEGNRDSIDAIELLLKQVLPIHSTGMDGFITEAVLFDDGPLLLEVLSKFFVPSKDHPTTEVHKIYPSDLYHELFKMPASPDNK